ncbi:MAG: Coenzyme F420 hydrogenase/dehydrogenase, beta subunit C-terminal domain [Pseudoprimorskyibacter sp.]|nr:Coenzyme F420 hydrogenase/dehydrogenase, beta subunit C-terminal domain [Pseudoprimorskyibacter sp.]
MPHVQTDPITHVVASQMCTGCGACAGLVPDFITMVDDPLNGRRPVVQQSSDGQSASQKAISVCAGAGANHSELPARDQLDQTWGPVLAAWEGHATDSEIRHRGSSGGAGTALALFMLQSGKAGGVAHITANKQDPRLNQSVISSDRDGLLAAAGSRYAQASPAELLGRIRNSDDPIAFIGKPCDVASMAKAASIDPVLADHLAVTIAIFCAGAPNLNATDKLLDRLEVPIEAKLTDLRYRGEGWPGLMQASYTMPDGSAHDSLGIPYAEGWGRILQAERRWRCRICADHTGEFADISVGDPWHNPPEGDLDDGQSLIIARTAKGERIIRAAIEAGVINTTPASRDVIARAQPNLLDTRGAVWGRRLAMRLTGLPVPNDKGLSTFRPWMTHLSLKAKLQSVAGALKRIFRLKLHRKVTIRSDDICRGSAR